MQKNTGNFKKCKKIGDTPFLAECLYANYNLLNMFVKFKMAFSMSWSF